MRHNRFLRTLHSVYLIIPKPGEYSESIIVFLVELTKRLYELNTCIHLPLQCRAELEVRPELELDLSETDLEFDGIGE